MAINAQVLQNLVNNPDFNMLEQLLLIFLEGFYDKELYLRFTGTYVDFNRRTEFEAFLKAANINLGRYTKIYDEIVSLYTAAGWTVTYVVSPDSSVIRFTAPVV